jgi:hypothetical protein
LAEIDNGMDKRAFLYEFDLPLLEVAMEASLQLGVDLEAIELVSLDHNPLSFDIKFVQYIFYNHYIYNKVNLTE